jgi:hypothetical protein
MKYFEKNILGNELGGLPGLIKWCYFKIFFLKIKIILFKFIF